MRNKRKEMEVRNEVRGRRTNGLRQKEEQREEREN
jgi:hypothetical protein